MASFQDIINDIKALRVQGAENVAKASAKAMLLVSKRNSYALLSKAEKILFSSRPTEPCMRNVLDYLMYGLDEKDDLSKVITERYNEVLEHFSLANERISKYGAKKIFNGCIVFTHCHSSNVVNVLKQAKKEGKRFQVHNTETRPLFQGRLTARELSREGIPVTHYIDSAARVALKKSDLMMIGCDAISSEGKIINKIGSEMFAEMAEKQGANIYVCTDSWKFDPKTIFGFEEVIELRAPKEIWPTAPSGVKVDNHAFEKIDPDLITGIISEIGIYKPEVFVEEVKKVYSWMF